MTRVQLLPESRSLNYRPERLQHQARAHNRYTSLVAKGRGRLRVKRPEQTDDGTQRGRQSLRRHPRAVRLNLATLLLGVLASVIASAVWALVPLSSGEQDGSNLFAAAISALTVLVSAFATIVTYRFRYMEDIRESPRAKQIKSLRLHGQRVLESRKRPESQEPT